MHLRRRFVERWDSALYGDRGKLVLGVVLAGHLAEEHGPDDSNTTVRSITWAQLAGYRWHPNGDEFARYLAWKGQAVASRRQAPGRLDAASITAGRNRRIWVLI
jgi:hypothetical protein